MDPFDSIKGTVNLDCPDSGLEAFTEMGVRLTRGTMLAGLREQVLNLQAERTT